MSEVAFASFSGGRSSGMMIKRLLDEGAELDHIYFANTGLESPATYEFIKAVDEQWLGGRLTCLEFTYDEQAGRGYRIVKRDELDQSGAPFTALYEASGMLPSPRRRLCTDEMKVRAVLRALYDEHGVEAELTGHVGLRADELQRVAKIRESNAAYDARLAAGKRPLKWTCHRRVPLADAGMTRADVLAFYREHRLDGLAFDPADPGMHLSNCLGCFYSNLAEKVKTAIETPHIARWWRDLELRHYKLAPPRHGERPPPGRWRWIREHLGREPDESNEAEMNAYAINSNFLWAHIDEYAELTKAGKSRHAIPLLDLGRPMAGGCESGECGLDL